ncbi:arylsulfatase [Defluviimonas sp. D31]|uniref:arylsulfatase n=1 Tax=Defluviimonas sp. D31 TaxID=3083253 RepID=UPI00296F98EF|nr:arylsulfatase [Defluviimonas sp. D31]MDW4549245.1 arylsulfatase [Defluviimonas sp. D31]
MNRLAFAMAAMMAAGPALSQDAKPLNFLMIWGDDVGYWNISAYNQGMMGYETPNIDRIAKEGMLFTHAYGEQSCTAGRASFVTGQSGFRTGLLKVGLPGAKEGMDPRDPTIAEYLKSKGYMTGQYGKNHLGDRDEHLPTNHGFDEFFGNLYHLNAEEEPENEDYPKNPEFRENFGPRGVIKSSADGSIEDTGPLTKKRMETIDEEVTAGAIDFMERAVAENKPFFLWYNTTRMHIFTHLKEESRGVTGLGVYPDGMVEHDAMVGQMLNKVDELGIADNTVVMYSTDNGAEVFSWPDGGTTPFRGEKNDNWEGGYRIPLIVKWPGVIEPGRKSNAIISHLDWFPTIMSALGDPDMKEKMLTETPFGEDNTKVHLDGYDFMPYFKGEAEDGPRHEFFYFSDGGDLVNLRYDQYKVVFAEQRAHGFDVWQEPLTYLRLPKVFNLMSDPFERAEHESIGYSQWRLERAYLLVPAQAFVGKFLQTFVDYPPRQKPASFSIDQVLQSLQTGGTSSN